MIENPKTAESHWKHHAAQWESVGSPLRPVDEDAALYWRAITSVLAGPDLAAARVLLLGVTPELVSLRWPASSAMFACDASPEMLKYIWPQGRFPGVFSAALNTDWRALPIDSKKFKLIIGDGCLTVLGNAIDYRTCAREFYRVLQPGGGLVLRLFCQPPTPELPEQVLSDLRSGNVGGFHAFKWRLVMAIHAADPKANLADVWASWESAFPKPELTSALSGWPLEAIATFAAYRNASARYSFYTLHEVCAMLSPEFEFLGAALPAYELGERCPVVCFRRHSV